MRHSAGPRHAAPRAAGLLPRTPPAARVFLIAVMAASLICGSMVWSASRAVFSGTTSNPGNSFTAGSVSLSDDDNSDASVLFNVSALKPGSTGSHCIQVTYTGSLTTAGAGVRMYASNYTGTLGTYLDIVIEQDTQGSPTGNFSGCGNFSGSTIYSGTLAAFVGAKTTWATGVPAASMWAPTANGQTKVYKITYTLQDNNSAQTLSSGVKFWWEGQTT